MHPRQMQHYSIAEKKKEPEESKRASVMMSLFWVMDVRVAIAICTGLYALYGYC